MRIRSLGFFCLLAGLAATPCAFSQTYANLTSATVGPAGTVTGTLGASSLTYTGDVYGFQSSNGTDYGFAGFNPNNVNPWVPTSTYTSATVATAPVNTLIAINSGGADTVSLVAPVSGLIMDVFSLGGSGTDTTYTFSQPFTVLSCGPNAFYGGGCFSQGVGYTGTTLSGVEANGTIEFLGNVSDLTVTVTNPEQFSGFDFGQTTPISSTPEPSSLALLGTGVLGAAGMLRRRMVRK